MSQPIDRRDFVATCSLAIIAPLLGACASLASHPVPIDRGRVRLRLADHPSLGQPGGAVKILPDGAMNPLYVLSLQSGAFAVLSPVCTHRGCTVDIQGTNLVCPCHGSTYDREGRVLRGPAERPLKRHDATVVAGVLEIDARDLS
jgi:Rieske Fe-S protein